MITLMLALAAAAADPASKPEPVQAPAPATATAGTRPAAELTRYCIKDQITGSRIRRKVCQTREEWRRAGVELND